jgi:hypothetical protein
MRERFRNGTRAYGHNATVCKPDGRGEGIQKPRPICGCDNVSNNLGFAFTALRTSMVDDGMSLGQAIQNVKKTANVETEVRRAETEAGSMIKSTSTSTATTSTSSTSTPATGTTKKAKKTNATKVGLERLRQRGARFAAATTASSPVHEAMPIQHRMHSEAL